MHDSLFVTPIIREGLQDYVIDTANPVYCVLVGLPVLPLLIYKYDNVVTTKLTYVLHFSDDMYILTFFSFSAQKIITSPKTSIDYLASEFLNTYRIKSDIRMWP